mgnify:CR=1 FL=1
MELNFKVDVSDEEIHKLELIARTKFGINIAGSSLITMLAFNGMLRLKVEKLISEHLEEQIFSKFPIEE